MGRGVKSDGGSKERAGSRKEGRRVDPGGGWWCARVIGVASEGFMRAELCGRWQGMERQGVPVGD